MSKYKNTTNFKINIKKLNKFWFPAAKYTKVTFCKFWREYILKIELYETESNRDSHD